MNIKSPAMLYREAVDLLVNKQNALYQVVDNQIVEWYETELEQPSQEEIQAKIQELQNAEPMRLLREERNRRLQETDWWAAGDRIDSMTNEQKIYRKQLRDLPSIFSSSSLTLEENTSGYPGTFLLETSDMGLSAGPSLELNENGQLSNVTWPTKPE